MATVRHARGKARMGSTVNPIYDIGTENGQVISPCGTLGFIVRVSSVAFLTAFGVNAQGSVLPLAHSGAWSR